MVFCFLFSVFGERQRRWVTIAFRYYDLLGGAKPRSPVGRESEAHPAFLSRLHPAISIIPLQTANVIICRPVKVINAAFLIAVKA
jgi:hypothetical protein